MDAPATKSVGSARTAEFATEADLAAELLRLKGMIDAAVDGILTIDDLGRVESANGAAARMFGRGAGEIVGQEPDRFISGLTLGELRRRTGQSEEATGVRGEGEPFPMDVAVSDLEFAGRHAFLVIVRDLTARKKAEAADRDRNNLLRAVVEAVADPIFAKDLDGRYIEANAAIVNLTGIAKDDVIGRTDEELFGAELARPIREADHEVLSSGETQTYEVSGDVTGTMKHFEITKGPFFDGSGNIIGLRGICRDITERKETEHHVREQQSALAHLERLRTLGQMATGLAHELNQPLGAIGNYAAAARVMLEMGAPANKADEILAEIIKEAARAGEIIRRMRGFARKQVPASQREDPNAMVHETMGMMAYDLRAANVEPLLDLGIAMPAVDADPIQVQQVLVNLVRNAIDAMEKVPEGERKLVVRTFPAGDDHVAFQVSDNGCGVKAEDVAKVFDAFYTTKRHGLGVGLALCRTIVEDHRGQLGVRRNADGVGMTFEFTLRRAAPPRANA